MALKCPSVEKVFFYNILKIVHPAQKCKWEELQASLHVKYASTEREHGEIKN
jgi:hypothetical protein